MIRQIVRFDRVRHGRLDTERDFVAIDDTVEAFIAAAGTNLRDYTPLNVSTGCGWSMRYVLDQLLRIAERPDLRCVVDPARMRRKELVRLVGSPAGAAELLGWKPQVDLTTALRRVHDAFLETRRWPYEDRIKDPFEELLRSNQDTPRGLAPVGA
jgi:nucleoside-diphosphate-sugar epimerase